MGTMNCIVSHSTVICYRFFLKVCSKEHNLELFQITLWLASQVIKRGDGSITPVRTKKSSWTLLRMVMVERLVRIFLNEKYSYFLSQLFSTVMSGTTTNDMKHRFGHVVPKDAIYLLYYIFCFRVWQRVSRVVQEQHRNGDKHKTVQEAVHEDESRCETGTWRTLFSISHAKQYSSWIDLAEKMLLVSSVGRTLVSLMKGGESSGGKLSL